MHNIRTRAAGRGDGSGRGGEEVATFLLPFDVS